MSSRGHNGRPAPCIVPCLAAPAIVLAGVGLSCPQAGRPPRMLRRRVPRRAIGGATSRAAATAWWSASARIASDVGLEVLKRGGNATDAAVATAAALAVTWPAAGNIGGGGYMLIVPAAAGGRPVVVDFRETAPGAATRDMFVEPAGRTPHRRVGVPGTVPRPGPGPRKVRQAAVEGPDRTGREAGRGRIRAGRADGHVAERGAGRRERRRSSRSFTASTAGPAAGPWRAGDVLVQPDLAGTLRRIAERRAGRLLHRRDRRPDRRRDEARRRADHEGRPGRLPPEGAGRRSTGRIAATRSWPCRPPRPAA